jgi:hypothetical protein
MEERSPIWRVAVNKSNNSRGQPARGDPPAWGLGEVLITPLCKIHMLRITHKLGCSLWRQNNPEVNYSPTRISGVGVFLEDVSRSRKRNRDILIGTIRIGTGGGHLWVW